jgi:hypothetical protein
MTTRRMIATDEDIVDALIWRRLAHVYTGRRWSSARCASAFVSPGASSNGCSARPDR